MIPAQCLSIVIPAKNESAGLQKVLPKLLAMMDGAELVVVDDGSSDDTRDVAQSYGVQVVSHPYSKGNGAAIKTGVRAATRDWVLCMDADSQHDPNNILSILEKAADGFHMVVGARDKGSQASLFRGVGNGIYNMLASWVVGYPVLDLTSGFRLVEREKFVKYLDLLPNGFSYPTTITLAFFKAGFSVGYVPVTMPARIGKSHLSITKDGFRFFMILFKLATLHSPLKVFLPFSVLHLLVGVGYYSFTYISYGRFTNMSLLLISLGFVIFLMGLLSEQITALYYKDK